MITTHEAKGEGSSKVKVEFSFQSFGKMATIKPRVKI